MNGGTSGRPDRAGLVIAVLLAAVSVVIFVSTRSMPATAQYARVGPATFPYAIAAGFALLAIGTAVSAFRGGFPEREPERLAPILWIVGGLVAQLLVLKPLGFSIATGLLFALTARGFGRGPLWLTIPLGVVFSLLVWIVFARVLQLSLPAGPLERLVP
ncbi:MAG TPA: tripartite tricarboxylate transporter TctB family protein [Amaricoccus sp.]|nr:tripartite tricarboxylate transporter TctB family protein [Amaricoccus sp.]